LQFIRFSIHPSSVGIDPESVVGDRWWGSGDRAVSISMLLSIARDHTDGEQRWDWRVVRPGVKAREKNRGWMVS
jgi:hypothetical protein